MRALECVTYYRKEAITLPPQLFIPRPMIQIPNIFTSLTKRESIKRKLLKLVKNLVMP